MPINPGRILFHDDHLLVVQKLPLELVVAAGGKGKAPLFDFLRAQYPGLRVVHRLDYETSGVLVFARSKAAAAAIRDSGFRGWEKMYRALVAGSFDRRQGEIHSPLAAREREEMVEAHTAYRVLEQFRGCADVECVIATGRKHQIRKHFAAIGHPLLFDPLYGDRRVNAKMGKALGYKRFFLHALRVRMPHPITGKPLTLEAPLPRAYQEAVGRLRQTGGEEHNGLP
jgi:23S rRNA pseudouridine955/2504/2580 synthase